MLESKLEGSNLLLSSPYWGPPIPLTLAVVAGGCLRADGGGVCVVGGLLSSRVWLCYLARWEGEHACPTAEVGNGPGDC